MEGGELTWAEEKGEERETKEEVENENMGVTVKGTLEIWLVQNGYPTIATYQKRHHWTTEKAEKYSKQKTQIAHKHSKVPSLNKTILIPTFTKLKMPKYMKII